MPSKSKSERKSDSYGADKKKKPMKKDRGIALTIALIIMAVHGAFAAYLYHSLSVAPEIQRPWLLSLMVIHSLANILAAAGIFYWKKWGLYIYSASTILSLVAGLISVGAWSVFYMVLPVAILGWLLRTKWDYFD